MSKQSKSNASTIDSAVSDESPGANFQIFVDMQNLYNKLKLLNYDNEYVSEWRMKPLSRIYFAIQTNSGEQLHSFLSLASWLFQKAGYKYEKPSEVHDLESKSDDIVIHFPIQYKHPKKPVNLTNNNDFSNLTLNDIQTTILNIFKTAKTFIDELKTTGLLKRNNVYELKELSLAVYK
ncbi:unnamed protein product [Didymodactylos carnosus]|uniref:Uncharacterized protein n=1 Tax=Didymodactylos carnosus TaxID=1234261 RepID=A0A8S2ERV2_9BILA|nr:unnamed protein product [Didymodactylos carnosus]CAF4031393.1 unnamed protein product [Didymodactylos carnosus]